MARIVAIEAAHAQVIGDIIDTTALRQKGPPHKPDFLGDGERWNLRETAMTHNGVPATILKLISKLTSAQLDSVDAVSIAISAAVKNTFLACLTHEAGDTKIGFGNLQSAVTKMFGRTVPVYLGNRSTFAAWGEYACGMRLKAANKKRDFRDLLYITVSGNLGAGFVFDGKPYVGANGLAGEVGHLILDPASPAHCDACGHNGCASVLASGRALVSSVKAAAEAGQNIADIVTAASTRGDKDQGSALDEIWPDTGHRETLQIGRDTYAIDSLAILSSAQTSPVACQAVETMSRYLAQLIAELTYIFDQELVILGGIATAYPGLDDKVGAIIQEQHLLRNFARGNHEVLNAWFGSKSALYGAALWAERELQGGQPKPRDGQPHPQDPETDQQNPPIQLADRQSPAS